jgi:hypothetical protein
MSCDRPHRHRGRLCEIVEPHEHFPGWIRRHEPMVALLCAFFAWRASR